MMTRIAARLRPFVQSGALMRSDAFDALVFDGQIFLYYLKDISFLFIQSVVWFSHFVHTQRTNRIDELCVVKYPYECERIG